MGSDAAREKLQICPEAACHGIIDSLRFEKPSKVMKSNCQPITTMPTKVIYVQEVPGNILAGT